MKPRIYIIGALLLMYTNLLAQSEQQVTVLEYNGTEEKTPLSQVSVTVLNAGSTISDEKGEAVLKFRTLHAGDQVSVRRIEKAGYEIFNSQAIEQWNVSPQRAFQIILCRSDKFMALREQYCRVASDSYAKQYKAAQARLAAERKKTKMLEETYQQKMLDLENQYQQQLEDLENYVDQFARIDLSELNSQQQELINLVREGKIDEAIRKYESEDYQAQYKKQCEEIAKIDRAQAQLAVAEAQKRSDREKIFQAIHRQIATYRLAGGRENFQKVTNLLKSVAEADTTNLEAVLEFAHHSLRQNNVDDCEQYLNIYIRGCQDNPFLQASAYNSIASNYLYKHDFETAEKFLLSALSKIQPLTEKEPERYSLLTIDIKISLVNNYFWSNKINKALEIGKSSVIDAETGYLNEPEDYAEQYSYILSTQGKTYLLLGDIDSALRSAKMAYSIAHTLYEQNKEDVEALIRALECLSGIYYYSEKWDELEKIQTENMTLIEMLYQNNPDENLSVLMSSYNNLSEAQIHLNKIEEAEDSFIKSEEYLMLLIQKNPNLLYYERFTLYELGARLYNQKGDMEKMVFYRDAAIKAYEMLQPAEKDTFINEYEGLKKLL